MPRHGSSGGATSAGGAPGPGGGGRSLPRSATRDSAVADPPLPEGIDPHSLDPDVRRELRSVAKPIAERVGAHLVAAAEFVDGDPSRALAHAHAAKRLASRVRAVREATGICAYLAGEYTEALSEFRAVARMGGDGQRHLEADCERALGRPDRALAVVASAAPDRLDDDERVELALVEAGARRDLGQLDAALGVLRRAGRSAPVGERSGEVEQRWVRLWYAYADALQAAGETEKALVWFTRAADADADTDTDAAERAAALS